MDTQTLIRTIVLAVALVNQFLVAVGYSPLPLESEELEEMLSTAALTFASLWAWYKNNSITKAAKAGDSIMRAVKSGNLDADEVQKLVDASSK